MLGERSLDGALEKVGIVEAFENRLGAFIQAFALFLKLAQDLKAGLEAGGFLSRCVEDSLGILAFVLGVLVVRHRRGGFSLGVLERQMGGIRAAFQIFQVCGNLGSGSRRGFDFVLEQMETRFAGFPASGGGGNLPAQRVQARLGAGEFGPLGSEFPLGCDALLAHGGEAGGVLIKRLLMGAEALDHLLEKAVRLLDLLLLCADFFLGLADVQAVAVDEGGGFRAALVVCADAVLG